MASQRRRRAGPEHAHGFWRTPAGLAIYNGTEYAARGAFIAACLATVYLTYGLLGGYLAKASTVAAPAFHQFRLGAIAFAYACIILAVAVAVRYYADEGYMIGLLFLGAFAFIAVPLVVNWLLGEQGARLSTHAGADIVNDTCRTAGVTVFLIVAIRYLVFTALRVFGASAPTQRALPEFDRLARLRLRRAPTKLVTKPKAFAACWELPYCEEYLKEYCPNFKNRKSCWRVKIGCHCSPDLLASALRLDQIAKDPEMRKMAKQTLTEVSDKKLVCDKCRIFLEHQYRKFRFVSPFVPLGSALLVYALHAHIRSVWNSAVEAIAKACNVLSFSDGVLTKTSQLVSDLQSDAMMWAVYIVGGLFLLTGVARLVEWLVLDLKI